MCGGAAARRAQGSRRDVRRAAHVDERAAIKFDAVDVQHAVTNPAVGVERLCAKVLRRCAKDYAGQDTVRQAQVRVLYVLAPCASYLGIRTVRRRLVFAPSACVRHVCHACEHSRLPSQESSAGQP